MPSIEASLYSTLTTYAGLTALISTRVYAEEMPQGATLPCIVYRRISTPRVQAFGSAQTIVSSRPRFQFTCWAPAQGGALVAIGVIGQVRAALQASSYAVTFADERPLRDPDTDLHRRDLDAFVLHAGG